MTRVLSVSITAAGAALARRLPYEHRAGRLGPTVREEWGRCDAFILFASAGVAVRTVAPLLSDKVSDPAVVCVDDSASFAIALTGGHSGGANHLAREVAALLGATAVVTTATDVSNLAALDQLPGFNAVGDVAAVTRRWLDGDPPTVEIDPHLAAWPLPAALANVASARSGGVVTITDSPRSARPGEVLLRPATVVLGVGASTGAQSAGLQAIASEALAEAGLDTFAVAAVATIDLKVGEPAIRDLAAALGAPLVSFGGGALAAAARDRAVPNPSAIVAKAVGTPSVSEAAALLAAGPRSTLIAPKRISATGDSTVAIARRDRPPGDLAVVGLGPGDPARRTPEAAKAVRHAEVVIGYGPYVDLAADLLTASQEVIRSPIGAEAERCRHALSLAAAGARVALVCSGDPGVYAMASLVCELAEEAGRPPVSIVAGVTAALSGAAILGAPLGHDHASVSLSDLLTPWEIIVRRLRAVAEGDFVVSLYNPRSRQRTTQLVEALQILATHRPPTTPAAILTDIGRPGQQVTRATIESLDPEEAGMLSLVIIGSTQTRWIGTSMVTPRGYQPPRS